MGYKVLIISCIMFTCMLAACSSVDKRLENALAFAGDNRGELETVLTYYSSEPEKLEAARFLIRNMPHWYAYEGWQLDSIRQILASGNISEETVQKWKDVSFHSLPKVYDAKIITAKYLIENIDLAFEVWKKYPWNRNLGFDDFCELILPYRIDNEPLSSWRKLYHDHYAPILDSIYSGQDVLEACHTVSKKLNKKGLHYFTKLEIPHMDGEFLFYHSIGYCRESCDITVYAMRACGIPVTTDFFRYSPDYQHYHSWNVLRDTTGHFLPFDSEVRNPKREKGAGDDRKKGKVYRYCFGEQRSSALCDVDNVQIPNFFRNPYIIDVTSGYFDENEVTVPIQAEDQYIYLGVFKPNGPMPIDIAENNGNKVTFRNIEPNIIYQTLVFDGKRHNPAGYPFIYRNGKAELLEPDRMNRVKATLTRKMSIKPTISAWLYRAIIGARIEAANEPSFRNADLLYEFKDTLTTNYYELNPIHPYRKYKYIRYVPPIGKEAELAELTLYQDTVSKLKLPLRIISPIEPIDKLGNIIDDNILTYFQAQEATMPITFKLETASSIGKIVFSPRNDDNYIWPGDDYELFYHDGISGWQSLGVRTASGREICYAVPKNALLWLRDRTKGREEQVFIYKNGKQYFTIDIH